MKKILLILLLLAGSNTFAENISISDYKIIIASTEQIECRDVAAMKVRLIQESKIDTDTMCSEVLFLVEYAPVQSYRYDNHDYRVSVYCKERNYSDILAVSLFKTCLQESDLKCVKLKDNLDRIKKTKYKSQNLFNGDTSKYTRETNRCL
ncbi:MAG: hypothetical protein V4596_12565 [Bdellovibrionota bacterium]